MLNYPSAELIKIFANRVKLTNEKTGELSPFVLNEEQAILSKFLEKEDNVIVLKSRQIGVSTITALFDLMVALMNERSSICVALDTNSKAQAFIQRIALFCQDLNIHPTKSNSKSIEFSNGSKIMALGASGGGKHGRSTVGRSMSFNMLHVTELAFWENQLAFSALKACAPNGRVIVESTAHGPTGVFADLWHGDNGYKKVFFSVEQHSTYRMRADSVSDERWKELQALGFTNREAAAWWDDRYQASGVRESDFLRDFCVTQEQPFLLSQGRIFDETPVVGALSKVKRPCLIAVDVARGKGGDDTVIIVVSREDKSVIDLWHSNQDDVHFVTTKLKEFEEKYQPSNILVEGNGVGKGFITSFQLKGINVLEVNTTESTKEIGFGNLRKALREKVPVPIELATQISNLRFQDNRYYGRDDIIMAYCFALNHIAINPFKIKKPQSLIDKMLEREGFY